jgi:hydroxyacylglutathione hydrolase
VVFAGRLFEGNAQHLMNSLELLCALGDDCLVWPGHEYTIHNCQFALHVDPDNEHVQAKMRWAQVHREEHICLRLGASQRL